MAHKYIGLQALIDLLGGEKKRGSKGEHICLCPAHNDKDPSLSVREGDKGIVMTCTSRGCTTEAICERIGIKVSELFFEPLAGGGRRPGRPKASSSAGEKPGKKDDKPARVYGSYDEAYGWCGKLVCTYRYTDSRGALKFEVARLMQPNGEKTFRQHRPVNPDGSGKCAFPIRLDVPAELRDRLIYRQPETEAAIEAGETIYIVEGEKDADTMWGLGMAATTNAGGGTKDKWKEGHTEHFKGAAEVIILPDNDTTGEGHGVEVYRAIAKVARAVYIVHLREGYPDLPPKGDFSDLVDAVGSDEAQEILARLVREARESLWQKAQRAYAAIPGYGIVNGNTCKILEDGTAKRLCNFVALPVRELTIDDGASVEKRVEIAGWHASGMPFSMISIPIEQFKGLDWATHKWGMAANISPGMALRDNLRYVIQEAGAMVTKYETSYMHFGWRKINDKWCYLHHEGCIGADNVRTEYNDKLRNYGLDGWPEGMEMIDAAYNSYHLTELIQEHCSVPLLGITYLAPLCEFLDDSKRCGYPPAFATMLCAAPGSGKSTIAALFMSHYGHFNFQRLPANFESSANSIRTQAYIAKDSLFCIDDYHPGRSPQEQRRINDLAQMLARTFGDHADRGRLGKDLKLQASRPARCLALVTGEQPPDVGQSGVARYYIIRVDENTFPKTEDGYTELRYAREGALRMAMTGYIQWLATQADTLPDELREMYEDYRLKAHDLIAGEATNDRADGAVAHIMVGLTMMTRWMISISLMDEDMAQADLEKWWGLVVSNIKVQGRVSKSDTPTSMFIDAVRSLIDSGMVWVDDLTSSETKSSAKPRIGWMDADHYYLHPPFTYSQVVAFYRNQDSAFPLGKETLWDMLAKEGIIDRIDEKYHRVPKVKCIRGQNRRCLWIPRWKLDGSSAPEKQERMEFHATASEGFTDVPLEDIPKEMQ